MAPLGGWAAAALMDGPRTIFVSSKKNIMFYFYLTKNFLENSDTVHLRACGTPITTALVVAEMLRDGDFIRRHDCTTSTLPSDQPKTQLDIALFKSGDPATGGNAGDNLVYVAHGKPLHYWASLVEKFLANGECTVSACGKSMALAVAMHELYRTRAGFHAHPLRTRTVVRRGPDRSWKKTEVQFEVQKV